MICNMTRAWMDNLPRACSDIPNRRAVGHVVRNPLRPPGEFVHPQSLQRSPHASCAPSPAAAGEGFPVPREFLTMPRVRAHWSLLVATRDALDAVPWASRAIANAPAMWSRIISSQRTCSSVNVAPACRCRSIQSSRWGSRTFREFTFQVAIFNLLAGGMD